MVRSRSRDCSGLIERLVMMIVILIPPSLEETSMTSSSIETDFTGFLIFEDKVEASNISFSIKHTEKSFDNG